MKKLLPYIEGLHVLPWFTDGAINFLDSFIFHIKQNSGKNPVVFEFGGGGSTFYFISRGCYVSTVEHDLKWSSSLIQIVEALGKTDVCKILHRSRPYNFAIEESSFLESAIDIVSIDGRDRVLCLETTIRSSACRNSILILDNTERIADKYSKYIDLLANHTTIHFECPFTFGAIRTEPETTTGLSLNQELPSNGLSAHSYRDRSGNCNKGRSITTIAIPQEMGMFTTMGIPLK